MKQNYSKKINLKKSYNDALFEDIEGFDVEEKETNFERVDLPFDPDECSLYINHIGGLIAVDPSKDRAYVEKEAKNLDFFVVPVEKILFDKISKINYHYFKKKVISHEKNKYEYSLII